MPVLIRRAALAPLLCLLFTTASCDVVYPEVVVVNDTRPEILIRNVSFSGCLWTPVLAYGDATSPGRCLPGTDRVHFQKLDVSAWCRDLPGGGRNAGCSGDAGLPDDNADGGVPSVPLWFNYQTAATMSVGYSDFRRVEITIDGWEQDFSVPGPYGH